MSKNNIVEFDKYKKVKKIKEADCTIVIETPEIFNEDDFNTLSALCCKCNTVIYNETFFDEPNMNIPKECPKCGNKLKNKIIFEF